MTGRGCDGLPVSPSAESPNIVVMH